jgi:hypothetical protein
MVVCEFTNHGLRKFSYEFHPTALRHQDARSAHSGFPQAVGRMQQPPWVRTDHGANLEQAHHRLKWYSGFWGG